MSTVFKFQAGLGGAMLLAALLLPATMAAAADVVGVELVEADGSIRVEIQATGDWTYRTLEVSDPPRFVVDVIGALHRLDSHAVQGDGELVQRVRTSQYRMEPDPVTRIVVDLAGPSKATVERSGRGLAVDVAQEARSEGDAAQAVEDAEVALDLSSPLAEMEPVVYQPVPMPQGSGTLVLDNWQDPSSISQIAEPTRREEDASYARTMSVNVQNSDINTVLRAIADFSGRNIISSPEVEGQVTVALRGVPWKEALGVILRANNFGYVEENGIIRVDTAENLRNEALAEKAAAKQNDELEALVTEVVIIDFANAGEIKSAVEHMLTGRGSVEVDERTNSLIVNDIPSSVEALATLARQLDTKTPQVHIEAMLVDLDTRKSRELGVQWGAVNVSAGDGNAAGDFTVDSAIEQAAGQLRVGTVQSWGELRLTLQAMARSNLANIISNPRITTTNNREAEILVGQKIPLITSDVAGNAITRLETIGIRLIVTPHINSDDQITLDVHPEVSDLSSQATVQGGVIINTSEADTRVLVSNYETAVIAGLIRNNSSTFTSGVPVLKDIPLLGALFRSESKTNEQRELIAFLTPSIVQDEGIMTDRELEMRERIIDHLEDNRPSGP